MFPIMYGTWFSWSTSDVTRVQRAMDWSSTTASAFPSQAEMAKIFWSYLYMHRDTHTHTYILLSLSLCVYKSSFIKILFIKVLFPLPTFPYLKKYLYKFYNIYIISFSIIQNSKCLKTIYFWLGQIRNFMWIYSV